MSKRVQVKIFSDRNKDEVEKKANAFLHTLPAEEVVDVKFSSSDGTYDVLVSFTR